MTEPNKDQTQAAAAAPVPAPAPAAPAAPAPATTAAAKAATPASKLEITGVIGGPLAIYGENLGTPGKLIVNSREITPSAWYTDDKSHRTSIKATLPNDIGSGPVEVKSGDGKTFTGYLGTK